MTRAEGGREEVERKQSEFGWWYHLFDMTPSFVLFGLFGLFDCLFDLWAIYNNFIHFSDSLRVRTTEKQNHGRGWRTFELVPRSMGLERM